jgi:hypothetical protein
MTTTPRRPRTPESVSREDTDRARIGREFAGALGSLVEESHAEARAVGRQYRLIFRMWQLQVQAQKQRSDVEDEWSRRGARPCRPGSLQPDEQALRDVAEEIGPALRLPANTALRRVDEAVLLGQSLPEVLGMLENGLMGSRQALVIVDFWRELVVESEDLRMDHRVPVESVRRIVDELMRRAEGSTAAQLKALARRRRFGILRETEEQRHRLARQDRRVWLEPREDGMAQLCALLDAATAHAIQDRIDALVERTDPLAGRLLDSDGQLVDGEFSATVFLGVTYPNAAAAEAAPRTLPQLRADVLADLLLDGEPADLPEHLRGIRGHVTITVPALALLEREGEKGGGSAGSLPAGLPRTSRCAELAGYGPIPVSMAERIAARAPSWFRVLTHPVTGTVLDHDRTTYAVPADLKRRLRARDGTCRFPGCRRRVERCDLDHTVAWADGGRTAADNLAHLCRHHHLVKHRDGPLGRWKVRHWEPEHAEGVLEWTSPAGRAHLTYPQDHRGPDTGPDPGPGQDSAPADEPPPF